MNGPEGFLPKKLNFTMQAVQVLWFRPLHYIMSSFLLVRFSFVILVHLQKVKVKYMYVVYLKKDDRLQSVWRCGIREKVI